MGASPGRRGGRPRRYVMLMRLALCALPCLAACQARSSAIAQATQPPQALDPLSRDERALAERLARADSRAVELLGPEARLASLEFLAMKGAATDAPVRHADALFARPDGDYGVRAIVRLGADAAVVEVQRVSASSVPMTQADIDQAWAIALADSAYTARLGRDVSRMRVEGLRIFSEDRTDPCAAGRCFYLIVRDGPYYVSGASVIVDLATRRVLPGRSPRQ